MYENCWHSYQLQKLWFVDPWQVGGGPWKDYRRSMNLMELL